MLERRWSGPVLIGDRRAPGTSNIAFCVHVKLSTFSNHHVERTSLGWKRGAIGNATGVATGKRWCHRAVPVEGYDIFEEGTRTKIYIMRLFWLRIHRRQAVIDPHRPPQARNDECDLGCGKVKLTEEWGAVSVKNLRPMTPHHP